MTYKEVINKWKLNQVLLASLIKMPNGTFKNKFSDNQIAYNFTGIEEQLIIKNLRELAADIMKIDATSILPKESKTDKPLPGLTAGVKQVKSNNLNKQVLGEKPYSPKESQATNLTYLQKRQQQKLK